MSLPVAPWVRCRFDGPADSEEGGDIAISFLNARSADSIRCSQRSWSIDSISSLAWMSGWVGSILQGSYLMQDAIFQHESSRLTRDEPAAPWRIAAMKGHARLSPPRHSCCIPALEQSPKLDR